MFKVLLLMALAVIVCLLLSLSDRRRSARIYKERLSRREAELREWRALGANMRLAKQRNQMTEKEFGLLHGISEAIYCKDDEGFAKALGKINKHWRNTNAHY